MKAKNIEAIIKKGAVIKLHDLIVDWPELLHQCKEQKLSVAERQRRRESRLNDQMRSYWKKAVLHVKDEDSPHPGRLLDQAFVRARQMITHEVG